MRMTCLFLASAALLGAGCHQGSPDPTVVDTAPATTAGSGKAPTGYAAVQEIFTNNCVGCHGAGRPRAGIQLTDYASVMKGGRRGPVVVAGKPDASPLFQAVSGKPGARPMPPKGLLPADQQKSIEDWIQKGAKA